MHCGATPLAAFCYSAHPAHPSHPCILHNPCTTIVPCVPRVLRAPTSSLARLAPTVSVLAGHCTPAGTYGRAVRPWHVPLHLTLHPPSNLPLHLAGHLRAVRPRRLGLDFSARVDQDDQGTPRVAPAQANIYGCVTRPRSLIIAASAGNAFPLTHACGGHRFESPPAFISTESPMELFHSADKVREA